MMTRFLTKRTLTFAAAIVGASGSAGFLVAIALAQAPGNPMPPATITPLPADSPSAPPGAGTPPATPAPPATAAPTPPPPAPGTPPPIVAFDDAFTRAATALFTNARLPEGRDKIPLVIDPLIDGVTGAQTNTTTAIGERLVELVRSTYPRFEVLPFTTASLERNPIVLIGTFTLINNAGQPQGPRDAFRICLALVDLNSRTKVAGGAARARPDGIDNTPTAFFSDSPVFTADPATGGYIKACQATPVGQKIDDVYVDQIRASAAIADAIQAYDQKRYGDALALYTSALNVPGGEQLRALNGLYLSYARLGRRAEAAEAFGRIVDYSLANNRLAVKFLFRPNSTRFFGESRVTPYQVWLRQIGDRAAARNVCLELVGHTSPTGSAGLNQRLSEIRAEAVRDRLTAAAPELSGKLLASGVGFRENMIGSGRDDASDALDRRVEFKVVSC